MNIFFLDAHIPTSVSYHCDKHVGKLLMESNQMLASAVRRHTGDPAFHKGYQYHPMTLWVGETSTNYHYALTYSRLLAKEWVRRYSKNHGSAERIPRLREMAIYIPIGPFTKPPLCMPDEFKIGSVVEAYRAYYRTAKRPFAKYTNRPVPSFMR